MSSSQDRHGQEEAEQTQKGGPRRRSRAAEGEKGRDGRSLDARRAREVFEWFKHSREAVGGSGQGRADEE